MQAADSANCRVLFFSVLRDAVGLEETVMPLPAGGMPVRELLDSLSRRFPALTRWAGSILVAVDMEYARPDDRVPPGAEVAIMPPVQGG
jgi:molybdopterin converting factor subunit 1